MRSLVLPFACVLLAAITAQAIPPDRLDHYHLVSKLSTLTQTGGIAGVEQRYRLRGEYDFLREWQTDAFSLDLTARFDNADIRAPLGDLLPAFIDVDELLNLELLRGELLPLGAPFDVYRFRGIANDSPAASPLEQSTVELYAALVGPWMYLYGETTPPPWTADYFEYEIRAVARTRPWLDLNEDGTVDAADYTLARDAAPEMLADWGAQYGEIEPDMAMMDSLMSAATATATAVPEPVTVVLLALAAPAFLRRRR